MTRLVVFSNRVPLGDKPSGGLVVALNDTMASRGGLWIGTETVREGSGNGPDALIDHPGASFERLAMALSPQEHASYYLGYSNSVLWPLFHGRADLLSVSVGQFTTYKFVNRRLAELSAPHLRPDDTIWIHDYHLIPLAHELRQLGVRNPIGFFLHIPFPAANGIRALSDNAEFLDWFSAYDLVGLQTQRDVANFIGAFRTLGRAELLSDGRLRFKNDFIQVASFPIGIDATGFRTAAEEAPELPEITTSAQKVMIGVDRLDYSKGLPHRLRGFQAFLRDRHVEADRIAFLQIAPPTREDVQAYKDIRRDLEQLSGEVNGEFGDIGYMPVQYIHRSIPRERLAGLFRRADIALVTPLNDGMNLVAKEYVAAQDEADPGVLILSRFAGAAEQLAEGALLINPYDAASIADGITRAVTMPLEERRTRHDAMWREIARHDNDWWTATFLQSLARAARSRRTSESFFAAAGE